MNRKEAITHIDAMINTAIIVKGIVPDEYDIEALRMAVDALSGESKQGWIPCSERLPNESGDYHCTIPLDANETYTEVLTFHKGRFYEDDDEWGATYHDDVIAWMPLPKPYKQKTERRG